MTCPHAVPGPKLAELCLDGDELGVLAVARHYFRSFCAPATQSWMGAIAVAIEAWGPARGPDVAVATLNAVQAMRAARASPFVFNNPCCAGCAARVTPNEQALLSVMRGVRRGDVERAAGHAVLLCEGNDHANLIAALRLLDQRLPVPRRVPAPAS
jgi:hypothetical protein